MLAFAETLSLPVTSTLMGLGGFPGNHPQFLGMLGMHGTYAANMAVSKSDVLIAIGARFDDRATGKVDEFAPHAKVIHVDIDPTSISKNIRVDVPIVGDARNVLKKMMQTVEEEKAVLARIQARHRESGSVRWLTGRRIIPSDTPRDRMLKPQYVIERIYELTKGKAIIATEVGQNQMWTAQFYKFHEAAARSSRPAGSAPWGTGFPRASAPRWHTRTCWL